MDLRTDKYYENEGIPSRTSRNQELYKEISKTELPNFEVRSNATVIGDNKDNIDVEKIKSILDTHYNDTPKRRSIKIEEESEEVPITVQETKEYDINVILDKARENKEDNYEEERNKKLRNTQFDILSNLDLEDEKDDHSINEKTAKELTELINTISINEQSVKKIKEESGNPLELFEDLKGSDETQVLEGINSETTSNEIVEDDKKETSMDTSFFTKSSTFEGKDFEEDFEDVDEKPSIFVKLVIVLLIIVFVVGAIILVKSFLN